MRRPLRRSSSSRRLHRTFRRRAPHGWIRRKPCATSDPMGITRFFRRRYWDDERAREIASHLAMETDDNIRRGMSPAEAYAAARRKLGNVTLVREEIYRMNTLTFLE